ncbi:protein BatD [Bacillus solimangrovi]|uniref:protein BatD n=1 Tax=Bacillus solimangrovi TaxID=1305675 RepID=UPI001112F96D|nr:protein BatD [Bacillus solimangrovi]
MWWLLAILVVGVLLFALFIDWRRKKKKNNPHITTNPNTKPGESSNYMMGDNKDTGGFQ